MDHPESYKHLKSNQFFVQRSFASVLPAAFDDSMRLTKNKWTQTYQMFGQQLNHLRKEHLSSLMKGPNRNELQTPL